MIVKKSYEDIPKVYLIPTPIGNMEDITIRAKRLLNELDVLFCEDTRVTSKLLNLLEIPFKKLYSFNDHNEDKKFDDILSFLEKGISVGVVSDQGSPLISDPGYDLVKKLGDTIYPVVALPGPTSIIPALSMSTLPTHPFLFYGFLKGSSKKQEEKLILLKNLPYTLIFLVSRHQLVESLKLFSEVYNERKISIVKEISKIYEETFIGDTNEAYEYFKNIDVKGEFVVIIEGFTAKIDYNMTITEHIDLYIEEGYSRNEAMKLVAKDLQISKSDVYKKYLVERDQCI